MRRFLHLLLVVVLTAGLMMTSTSAQAADTGNSAPQTGRIVSDEPGKNAPNILDGTVYSIAEVGNTIVVGGSFSQVRNYNTSATLTRHNLLAFDATTGKVSTLFAPDPVGTVFKVLPAADGTSVYVAGGFGSAAGTSMPGRVFKVDVNSGVLDSAFTAPTITGVIRDLQLVGNRLFIAGKFTHINAIAQKALGSLNATTGTHDPYMNLVVAGLHNTKAGAVTAVLQISVNKQNTRLMAVGNFTTVAGADRHQIVQIDIGGAAPVVSGWSTNLFRSACSPSFETYMSDVEYSPNGAYFVVSTSGAYGGYSGSMAGTSGCDVVARFESNVNALSAATWTAYPGGDTTWTVEVTDNVVYAGGHQRWQNNPGAAGAASQGAVSREGIAALNTVNGMPLSWNPTRARGVGVQDMLATGDGLYVGSDTELIGRTPGNTYHARIAVLPLASGKRLPLLQANALPVDLYRVGTGASQLTRRSFTGTSVGALANVANGPGWGTSTGAFMVNGVLYKTNTDGSLSKMSFDGTSYGTASAVNTADALVFQSDWHTDAETLTSIFYSGGYIYYTKSGVNALYRRGFEVESGIVGQQRFSTTVSSINYSSVRGAFVANGKLYYGYSDGRLLSATWNPAAHGAVVSTSAVVLTTGWSSRVLFPYQAMPDAPTRLAATPGDRTLQATWTAPAETGGSPLTGYTVSLTAPGAEPTTQSVGPEATSAMFTALTNGTTYVVSVVASYALGESAAATAAATPATVPSAVSGVSAVRGDRQATVRWVAPAETGGSPITGYRITSTPGGLTRTVAATARTLAFTGLTNGTRYTFNVAATNARGTGQPSAPSAAVAPAGRPTRTARPAVSPGRRFATVTWRAPSANGSAITRYQVRCSNGVVKTVAGSVRTLKFTGLARRKRVSFQVRAVNAVGAGAYSLPSATVRIR